MARIKAWLTRDGLLRMLFQLGQCAEKTWRYLRRFQQLPKVIEDLQFVDGFDEHVIDQVAA